MADEPLPGFLKRSFIQRRQHTEYVKRDGVDANTWNHVESIYLDTLDRLEAIFKDRPYILGKRPTLGDFGFFASMFRHFSQDPTASNIMRLRAPGVFAWQARLWNARASTTQGAELSELPADMYSMLEDIGAAYLPYLNQNALAWQQGHDTFDPIVQGVQYHSVPVSQYRVWCLEQLQARAKEVAQEDQAKLKRTLDARNCWKPLFEIAEPGSRYDEGGSAPFKGRKVHYHNRRD